MAAAVVFAEVVFAFADLIAGDDEEDENCSIEARKSSTVVKATAGGFGSRLGRAALAIKIVVLLITVYNNMKTVLKPNVQFR